MTHNGNGLPHWDMAVIFPSLQSPEFAQALHDFQTQITGLDHLFEQVGVGKQEALAVDAGLVQAFEQVLNQYNDVLERSRTLLSYVGCFVATDSRDTLAQAKASELQTQAVRLSQLGTRFVAWIGALDVEALTAQSVLAQQHAFALQHFKTEATHLMSPAEEALAAELQPVMGTAWGRLHGNITSQLSVALEIKGEEQALPMSVVRTLAYDPDRAVRAAAYHTELAGWQSVEVPLAAALNSIKGQVSILSKRRGWDSPLDEALSDNHIDRQTLDAMMTAAQESFPQFRRYLKAKAHLLGIPALAWYDLFAPLGGHGRAWQFDEAVDFIAEQFGTYSTRMRDFALRAFRERWVDAEPRAGKRDGAFCTNIRPGESRVFSNYQPAFSGVSTLAHELGHAYHNLNLAERSELQSITPMTLAETASIFCETIIKHAGLRQAEAQEQRSILEASLQGHCQVVVDISSRFLFEQRVFEGRQRREHSVDEFKALMLQAQRETYGDGLDAEYLHPYMWAMKPHYYNTGLSFYNFPYLFGLLFGLGLYAQYQDDPKRFVAGYDDLLSATGLADAGTLAQRFGINLRAPDFWRSSLAIIGQEIERFEALVNQTVDS